MSAKKKPKSKKKSLAKAATGPTKSAAARALANAKKTKAAKAKSDAKPKRVSALDAATQVLKATGKPMRAQELIAAMTEKGLWSSPKGQTPHATLYAAMHREAREKGNASRFKKVGRGLFEYAGKQSAA